MEELLHYIWEHRLYDSLIPCQGIQDVRILDPGIHNALDAGPDFYNAKVLIDGLLWVGTVEIHRSAKEWILHHHDTDPAYRNVILHVVEEDNYPILTPSGIPLPTCRITYPDSLRQRSSFLLSCREGLPCSPLHTQLPSEVIYRWLDRLADERLFQRSDRANIYYQESQGDWNEVFYIQLTRAFGFGLNGDAMERVARSLPIRILQTYRNDLLSLRALLLGQANLIGVVADPDEQALLTREYLFLSHKHGLTPIPTDSFRWGRTRPQSMPLGRLEQLARLLHQNPDLATQLLEATDLRQCRKLLRPLSKHAQTGIIINALCPYLVAYGRVMQSTTYLDRAKALLSALPPEDNRYTRLMNEAGIRLRHASDSQAAVQLTQSYCQSKKCIFCAWGRKLLSHPKQEKEDF